MAQNRSVKNGLKKFGVTFLFSILGVFRQFFNRNTVFGYVNPPVNPETVDDERFLRYYQAALEEIDVSACVESGTPELVCRKAVEVAA